MLLTLLCRDNVQFADLGAKAESFNTFMTVQLSVLMLGAADVSEVHAASMFMGKASVDCAYWPATGPKSSFSLSPIFMGLRDHLPFHCDCVDGVWVFL